MDQCAKILESVEDGKLSDIDFLELMACTGGCVGGPLTVNNPAIARHTIFLRERLLNERHLPGGDAAGEAARTGQGERCFRTSQFTARPALLLDPDYQKAMIMMEEMEVISEGLPGLDCGCCGAPNCHALAEDIVRGNASRTDCVIILKEQYRELLEKGSAG
jgi:Iron only hydrogenase large subunit, C-terminal domain./Putative Fe-S cluster.